jgi:hypothetical protein
MSKAGSACSGVDIGKRFVVACVRTPDPRQAGRWVLQTTRFDTTAEAIRVVG